MFSITSHLPATCENARLPGCPRPDAVPMATVPWPARALLMSGRVKNRTVPEKERCCWPVRVWEGQFSGEPSSASGTWKPVSTRHSLRFHTPAPICPRLPPNHRCSATAAFDGRPTRLCSPRAAPPPVCGPVEQKEGRLLSQTSLNAPKTCANMQLTMEGQPFKKSRSFPK